MAIDLATTRATASIRYFTGKPCKHGHISERYTASGACVECSLIHAKKWAASNPEKMRAAINAWRIANLDKHLIIVKRWQARNPEKTRQIGRRYRAANADKILTHGSNRRARNKAAVGRRRACNLSKGAKHPLEFAQMEGRLL
jgi:hypothetical protein